MNEKNTLESLFENLEGSWDLQEPREGHRERFSRRLDGRAASPGRRSALWWKPLSIAAGILLLFGIGFITLRQETSLETQVAEIAPEVSETSRHFAGLIRQQVQELELQDSPETRPLIEDTLRQLEQLEADYRKMEADLVAGGNSKLILSAMITNFQTRIDLLQDVMLEIEQIKQFKNDSNA